jgi:hypothetical protein
MPPARIGADILVERRGHEHLHRHAGAVLVEREADHLTDLHAPVENRRADVYRPERVAMQDELMALLVAGNGRRRFETDKVFLGVGRMAGIRADVGT